MHHASASAGLRDSTVRAAPRHTRGPRPLKETSAERLLAAARLPQPLPRHKGARLRGTSLVRTTNQSHVCARTDWYVRVVGQPQVLRNQPGRWPPSPGMTRRSSRSRCLL